MFAGLAVVILIGLLVENLVFGTFERLTREALGHAALNRNDCSLSDCEPDNAGQFDAAPASDRLGKRIYDDAFFVLAAALLLSTSALAEFIPETGIDAQAGLPWQPD